MNAYFLLRSQLNQIREKCSQAVHAATVLSSEITLVLNLDGTDHLLLVCAHSRGKRTVQMSW